MPADQLLVLLHLDMHAGVVKADPCVNLIDLLHILCRAYIDCERLYDRE